jgi:hypothetical protein
MNNNWKIASPKHKYSDPVEAILWDYPQYKLDTEMLSLTPSCIPNYDSLDMPRGTDVSDSTSKFAIRNADSENISYVICRQVEAIYDTLLPELQRICELYYWEKLKPSIIAERLNVSYPTLWKWKHELIYCFKRNIKI